ncbi:hypothetical protein QBC40DRAFT_319055 [Triangularia verruculosa]|uniref:Uncharacterized protein n=1 Tax=Triangularia verruculosa TaxID=2587418 RepID=A0AAN7AQA7_9PEZI|nr:hypothetical protein QBC40DRAFT_319055 [Triangularia verruculosa]
MTAINMQSIQTALEGIVSGERKNWDHNLSALPRWIHKLGWLYYSVLLRDQNVMKHGWLAGCQGKRQVYSIPQMPKPVRESHSLASTGLRSFKEVTGNLNAIVERSEIVSNFIERAIIEYREGVVGGFVKPLAAAERQMEKCVVLAEEMATAYNDFAGCLERTMKSSLTGELYVLDSEKREWVKDAALISKFIQVVYYNILTAAASVKKMSELLKPGLRLKDEPLVQLYSEALGARARLRVSRELAKLFTTAADSLAASTERLDCIIQDADRQYRTQLQSDERRWDALLEDQKDYVSDAAKQVCQFLPSLDIDAD